MRQQFNLTRYLRQQAVQAGREAFEAGRPYEWMPTLLMQQGWLAAAREADLAVDEAQATPRPGFDF